MNADKSNFNHISMQFWISTFLQSEQIWFLLQQFQMDGSLHLFISVLHQELNAQTNILQDSYLLELAEDWQTDHQLIVIDLIKLQFSLLLHWNKAAAISSGLFFFP